MPVTCEVFPPLVQTPQPPTRNDELQGIRHKKHQSNSLNPFGKDEPPRTIDKNGRILGTQAFDPVAVRSLHRRTLTVYEASEILKFSRVYFWGQNVTENKISGTAGFSTSDGDYHVITNDHLMYRYEILAHLSSGSFGACYKALDHKTGKLYAIKIIKNRKRPKTKPPLEVKFLEKINVLPTEERSRIVNIKDHFIFRGHACIVFELLGQNLLDFIRQQGGGGIGARETRLITRQLTEALATLKSLKMVHCDLKPENVALRRTRHLEVKLIDFGSSCYENATVYSYIQSRYYRAPEVILGLNYSSPIDMWSLGCLIAELRTGKPLFPGRSEKDQLAKYIAVLGPAPEHIVSSAKHQASNFEFDDELLSELLIEPQEALRRMSGDLARAIAIDDPTFVDFISQCLRWEQDLRLSPASALQHPYLLKNKKSLDAKRK